MATITLYKDKLNGVGGLIDNIVKSSNNLNTQLGTLKSTLQGEYHEDCLASEFFEEWYMGSNNYNLQTSECVGYKVPLFLNGDDDIDNLEVSDMEVYWEIMMPLINM